LFRIWNVDGAVARKISILWAFFMYIGQATKDVLGIPRPSSPPVLKLEKRYKILFFLYLNFDELFNFVFC
jgi:hypothetical protein